MLTATLALSSPCASNRIQTSVMFSNRDRQMLLKKSDATQHCNSEDDVGCIIDRGGPDCQRFSPFRTRESHPEAQCARYSGRKGAAQELPRGCKGAEDTAKINPYVPLLAENMSQEKAGNHAVVACQKGAYCVALCYSPRRPLRTPSRLQT